MFFLSNKEATVGADKICSHVTAIPVAVEAGDVVDLQQRGRAPALLVVGAAAGTSGAAAGSNEAIFVGGVIELTNVTAASQKGG